MMWSRETKKEGDAVMTLISNNQTRTYFRTYEEAFEVAAINQNDERDGWIYAVRYAPRGHYIEVIDQDGTRLGDL